MRSVVLAALAFLWAPAALAQVPPDIVAQLRAIGPKVDTEHTAAIYAPLQPLRPAGLAFDRDVSYGSDPKQTLDVVYPANVRRAPVLIYMHGGGFVAGDKTRNGKGEMWPFSDNVMAWAADHGMVGVNMNYRLAPGATYPAAQQDLAAVIAWVRDNIARYGGDPRTVFAWGHSAGAAHVASYVAHPDLWSVEGGGLKGAIMTSGMYDLTLLPKQAKVYFGDPEMLEQRSAKAGLLKTKVPLFLASGELDVDWAAGQYASMREALCAEDRCPPGGVMKNESHMSQTYSVGTKDLTVSGPVLAFIEAHEGK